MELRLPTRDVLIRLVVAGALLLGGLPSTADAARRAGPPGDTPSACSTLPSRPSSEMLASFVSTTLPLAGTALPKTGELAAVPAFPALSTAAPATLPPEVEASVGAMRALPSVDLRWQATFVVPLGSGWLTLAPPDRVEGAGRMVSTAWTMKTSGDQLSVDVGGRPVGDLPAAGTAGVLRDALLALPCYVSNPTLSREGATYRLQGRLSPGGGYDLLRQLSGLVLPGQPAGEISLAIDASSKRWQALDLHLYWPLFAVDVLGRPISWGPGGHVSIVFSGATSDLSAATTAATPQSPSALQLGLRQLAGSPSARSLGSPADVAFTVLNVRRVAAMVDEEPRWRAALATTWQRGGAGAPDYQQALQGYRAWERAIPVVGPLLTYLHEDASP